VNLCPEQGKKKCRVFDKHRPPEEGNTARTSKSTVAVSTREEGKKGKGKACI